MKTTARIAINTTLILLTAGVLFLLHRHFNTKTYTVGLVYSPSSSFHEALNTAIKKKLLTNKQFSVEEFAVASVNDIMTCNAVCNTAVESKVDLIICTGISCSQGVVQSAHKRETSKPIIFAGVNDPVEFGLIASITKPEKYITGIASSMACDTNFSVAELLLFAKPQAKKVLLPYIILGSDNEKEVLYIANILKSLGISATLLPIYEMTDAMAMITGALPGHDTLMYLKNDGIATCAAGLGKLASQHNFTLFAGSIDGIKDAALSYAANPACLAKIAVRMAKKILLEGSTYVPVQKAIVKEYFRINTSLCNEQDLHGIEPHKIAEAIRQNPRLAPVHNAIIIV